MRSPIQYMEDIVKRGITYSFDGTATTQCQVTQSGSHSATTDFPSAAIDPYLPPRTTYTTTSECKCIGSLSPGGCSYALTPKPAHPSAFPPSACRATLVRAWPLTEFTPKPTAANRHNVTKPVDSLMSSSFPAIALPKHLFHETDVLEPR